MGKPRKPVDFRKIINAELAARKKSRYWLANQEVPGMPSRNSIYEYLRGDRDMTGEPLAVLLSLVDVEPSRAARRKANA